MSTSCARCGAPAEGPGSVTIKIFDDQGLEQFGQVGLCGACARELGLFLRPLTPPAAPPRTDAEADLNDAGPETA
jgi:hypothetical protein